MRNVGVGVNDRLEQGVGFSWSLLRNEFSFLVEGLDIENTGRTEVSDYEGGLMTRPDWGK